MKSSTQNIGERIKQRTSELQSNYKATKKASQALNATIVKSLDASKQNSKDLESARKNGQITDPQYQSATFLNDVNRVINETLVTADVNTLNKINQNLSDIKKLISDYTKSSIDKQDTKIRYTDPTRKASEAQKAPKAEKSKSDKNKYGPWEWLKDLLLLGAGILPLIWAAKNLFKIGLGLAKLGKNVVSGVLKGLGWLTANVANLAKLTGKVISGIVSIIEAPVKWFTTNIWPSMKGLVSSLIKDAIKHIPGAGKALKFLDETIQKGKNLKNTIAGGITKAYETAKSGISVVKTTVSAELSALKNKLGNALLKKFPWIADKLEFFKKISSQFGNQVKIVFGKLYRILKTGFNYLFGGAKAGTFAYGSKLLNILKGIGKSGIMKAIGFVGGIMASPIGWIISALLALWMAFDFAKYLYNNNEKYGWDSLSLYFGAVVYALIGIDILNDKEAAELWETIEPMNSEEGSKLSANITRDTIRKASLTEKENIVAQLDKEYIEYQNKFNSLYNKTIKYKDSSGNVLSNEDSKKIQELEMKRADLLGQRAMLQSQLTEKIGNDKYYNGEVEISSNPRKFQELVNYFYDELKDGNFFTSYFGKFRDLNGKDLDIEKEKHILSGKRLMDQGEILEAAKEYAKASIYTDMKHLVDSGITTASQVEDLIRQKDKYESMNEKLNAISVKLNENSAELSNYGNYEVHSTSAASGYRSGSLFKYALGSSRAVAAAEYAWAHAKNDIAGDGKGKPYGNCAEFVNNAIINAGYKGYGKGHGYQVGASLAQIGWTPVAPPYKVGDVAVFNKSTYTNPDFGHTAILAKGGWVSDFKQYDMSPYPNQQKSLEQAVVYRDTGYNTLNPTFSLSNSFISGSALSNSSNSQVTKPVIIQKTESAPQLDAISDLTEYFELLPA